jgi:predicted DNA-binding transcriptional regulator AlpA
MQNQKKKLIRFSEMPDAGFVRVRTIAQHIDVNPSTLWRWSRSGDFPKPVKLDARTTAWRVSDIREHLEKMSGAKS